MSLVKHTTPPSALWEYWRILRLIQSNAVHVERYYFEGILCWDYAFWKCFDNSSSLKIHLQACATDRSEELHKKKQTWNFPPWVEKKKKTEILLLTFFINIWSKRLVTFDHILATDPCKTVVKYFSGEPASALFMLF